MRDAALNITPNYYYAELVTEWPKLYDIEKGAFKVDLNSDIDFFLDFIDMGDVYNQFAINKIGRRSKSITDNTINCIFAPEIPDYILIQTGQADTAQKRQEAQNAGETYYQLSPLNWQYVAASEGRNSAYEVLRMQLHEYTQYLNSVSITTLPIYHLESNCRIHIYDEDTGINGDYMVTSFSVPLTYNGTMTLQGAKAVERI